MGSEHVSTPLALYLYAPLAHHSKLEDGATLHGLSASLPVLGTFNVVKRPIIHLGRFYCRSSTAAKVGHTIHSHGKNLAR